MYMWVQTYKDALHISVLYCNTIFNMYMYSVNIVLFVHVVRLGDQKKKVGDLNKNG